MRWGLVGCGWVARDHVLPALRAAGHRLVAVADPDASACEAAGLAGCDLDALLARDDVDAVYVATPNHLHAPVTLAAAAAGKAVLCEKPMATTAADAWAMAGAVRAAGVRYGTAFDQRHHAAHRVLGALIASGELGTVTQARIHYACWLGHDWSADNWRIDRARAGGGAMIDLAPHGLDLLQVLLDDEWESLVALTQTRVHTYEVDDGAVLAGRFRSGALAVLQVAYSCPEALPRRTLEVVGTRGMAIARDTMGQTPGGSLTVVDATDGRARAVPLPPEDDVSPFLTQLQRFASGDWPWTPEGDARLVELLGSACR